ncbi:MAG: alpha/beta fold hydrolase [Gaiellaceae bacterium]
MSRRASVHTHRLRARLVCAVLPIAAAAVLAIPAPAQAAVPVGFMPCPSVSGFYCGTVTVPIDRSGTVPALAGKTIALHVMWKPAIVADTDGALIALAGGPGQAATPYAANFADALAPALGTRDLVVFDQRGTGESGPLDCPGAMSVATSLEQYVEMCAAEIGPARDFYSSKDSAEDIEAVRQAVGVDQIAIFGVSYGTYVAQLYSRLFPTHTAALVLDSVVGATGVDTYSLSNFAAVPKVLAANCSRNLCRGITANPLADLTKVVKRADGSGLLLNYVDQTGMPHMLQANEADIFGFIVEAFSVDAVARARFPAALRSALADDFDPLGRLLAPVTSSANPTMSMALYTATSCTDTRFPWSPSDPLSVREAKATTALDAIPSSAYSPFSRATGLALSNIDLCIDWPASSVDASVVAPTPDVPVLVIDGLEDDLTPLSDAVAVAALYPRSVRVSVPFTGHSAISDVWPNADTCVQSSLVHFFTNTPIPSCSFVTPFFRPVQVDPDLLGNVKPVRLKGIRGRTIGAVLGTLSDVTTTALAGSIAGLRGGVFSGSLLKLRLNRIVYVTGVAVSGTYNVVTGVGTVTVSGVGSHGTLSVRRGKKYTSVRGKLGNKPLSIHVRTSANDATVAVWLPRLIGLNLVSTRVGWSSASGAVPSSVLMAGPESPAKIRLGF